MTERSITLERAGPDELTHVERLLKANGLPSEDVQEKPGSFFLARAGADESGETRVVGAGGIEQYGSSGLLRSVVVEESIRGQGYGTVLCDRLEESARDDGIQTLYLLTTTAAAFFEGRGYEKISRSDAPSHIQETAEFSELCPDSATCMRKQFE